MTDERPRYHTLVFDSARWDGFVFRPDDIVITTPAKCGTTWTQMICALLIFQTTEFDRPLDIISPWMDMQTRDLASIRADLDAQTHRRFIKSHTPRPGLPQDPNVTYICVGRDPRDVSLSWDNHLENTDMAALFTARANAVGLDDIAARLAEGPPERPAELSHRFWAWIDDATPVQEGMSLAAMLRHLSTFWEVRDAPNVVMLHYDDLQNDLEGEMRRLAKRLGIEVADARWPELVEAATFDRMRGRADTLAPESSNSVWQDNQRFFNRGTSGQWRDLLNDDDLERYFRRVHDLAAPDLVEWVHHRGHVS